MSLSGHLWTIGDLARRALTVAAPESQPWRGRVDDPVIGPVAVSGSLDRVDGDRLVVIVHGLGGSAESSYAVEAAAASLAAGWSVLRLNLRGSDRSGEDYYHGGLTADLHAALASRDLREYQHLAVWGFSLGGHMALRAATEAAIDPRVGAVAAVSAPLDLDACSSTIDLASRWPYRRYMLSKLNEIYAAVAARRQVPVSVAKVRRVRHFREFDDLVVAPRFGFDSAEDYYRRASVGPRMARLRLPALYVGSRQDPVVPVASVEPWLDAAGSSAGGRVSRCWCDRGGHIGFPRDLDLGEDGDRGLYAQVVGWLDRAVHPPHALHPHRKPCTRHA